MVLHNTHFMASSAALKGNLTKPQWNFSLAIWIQSFLQAATLKPSWHISHFSVFILPNDINSLSQGWNLPVQTAGNPVSRLGFCCSTLNLIFAKTKNPLSCPHNQEMLSPASTTAFTCWGHPREMVAFHDGWREVKWFPDGSLVKANNWVHPPSSCQTLTLECRLISAFWQYSLC